MGKTCNTALLGGGSCGWKTVKISRETQLKLTSHSAYPTEEQDLPEQNPKKQNQSILCIWQQLRRGFQAYGKGGLVWKRGVYPWSEKIMKSKFRYFLSLSYSVLWVYLGAAQTNLESVLEWNHKVKMYHFNIENFWIGLNCSVMNPNDDWREVLMNVKCLGYQRLPC